VLLIIQFEKESMRLIYCGVNSNIEANLNYKEISVLNPQANSYLYLDISILTIVLELKESYWIMSDNEDKLMFRDVRDDKSPIVDGNDP